MVELKCIPDFVLLCRFTDSNENVLKYTDWNMIELQTEIETNETNMKYLFLNMNIHEMYMDETYMNMEIYEMHMNET